MLLIKQENKSKEDILSYFFQNQEIFQPPLEKRVDLNYFANKIYENGIQFWAFFDIEVAGFAACYFNHPKKEFGYITTISIKEKFQGKGLGKEIIKEIFNFAKKNEFKKIRLEVNLENKKVLDFYESLNFKLIENENSSIFMEKYLI